MIKVRRFGSRECELAKAANTAARSSDFGKHVSNRVRVGMRRRDWSTARVMPDDFVGFQILAEPEDRLGK
jgi:hypothetical protein